MVGLSSLLNVHNSCCCRPAAVNNDVIGCTVPVAESADLADGSRSISSRRQGQSRPVGLGVEKIGHR